MLEPPISKYKTKKEYRRACGHYQTSLLCYFGAMYGCGKAMPPKEMEALEKWELANIGGQIGTMGWPGWEKYIGKPPIPPERPASLKLFVKTPIPTLLRMQVLVRDGSKCVRCGSTERLHADHIIPEKRGGPTTLENLQTLCGSCNSKKGAKSDG